MTCIVIISQIVNTFLKVFRTIDKYIKGVNRNYWTHFFSSGIDDINQATVYPYKYGCNIIDNPKYDSNLSTIIFQHGYRENCFLTNNRMSCGIVASGITFKAELAIWF